MQFMVIIYVFFVNKHAQRSITRRYRRMYVVRRMALNRWGAKKRSNNRNDLAANGHTAHVRMTNEEFCFLDHTENNQKELAARHSTEHKIGYMFIIIIQQFNHYKFAICSSHSTCEGRSQSTNCIRWRGHTNRIVYACGRQSGRPSIVSSPCH